MGFIIMALVVIAVFWLGVCIIDALIWLAFAAAAFSVVYWIVKKINHSNEKTY